MAKLTLSLLLFLFLVAFSESRTPSDLPTDDLAFRDVTGTVAESAATILLPSEKPQSDAATVALTDPETTATGSNAQDAADVPVADEWPVVETEKAASVPLRTVTFRPYGLGGFRERTVPLSLRFPFRHGGRGCRHGHRGFRPRFPGREMPFGNDMILSGERSDSDLESRKTERQMAGRWIPVHHRRPRFGSVDVAWKEEEEAMKRPDHREEREGHEEREHSHRHWKMDRNMMKRPHRPDEDEDDEEREHHHHRHHHHHFRHHHHDHEEEERHGGEGIFKRIRKFLNHF